MPENKTWTDLWLDYTKREKTYPGILGKVTIKGFDPEHPEQFVSWFFGYSAQTDFPYALCVLWENAPDALSGRIGTARIARDLFQWIRNHPDL